MNPELQFWGSIAGILGLIVAILALLRDVFDFQLEWASSSNFLKRLAVNRRFQLVVAVALIGFAFWSLYNKNQGLEATIAEQEKNMASAYATQTVQVSQFANEPTNTPEIREIPVTVVVDREVTVIVEKQVTVLPPTYTPFPTYTPLPTNTPFVTPTNPPPTIAPTNTPSPEIIKHTTEFVDAKMNIFGAGKAVPPTTRSGTEGLLPVCVSFPTQSGQVLKILETKGDVSGYGDHWQFNGADGGPFCNGRTYISSYDGISGIVHNSKTMFLVGVFLGNTEPSDPAPDVLAFTDEVDDFETLSPLLHQVFYIGDGLGKDGIIQQFQVPESATRLCLGFAEGYDFGYPNNPRPPGYYSDNDGGLTVSFEIHK